MPTLSTTRTFRDGEVLVEADLDVFLDDIEAFVNTTRLNDDNIQNNGITGSLKLLNQSVTEAKLAANAVTTLKIANDAVTEAKIANNAVTTDKIEDDAVTSDKLAELSVTTGHIGLEAVQEAQLADNAVTSDKLSSSASVDDDRAVTTNHIRNEAVTTAKIANGAVTPAKLSTNYVIGTANGTFNVAGTTATFNLSASLTTTGRPIRVTLYDGTLVVTTGTSTGGGQPIYLRDTTSGTNLVQIANCRTAVTRNFGQNNLSGALPDPAVYIVSSLAAGTYTFAIFFSASNTASGSFSNVKVLIEEL